MCWGVEVTAGMVAAGVAGAAVTWRRGEPPVIPLTLLYFAGMEALQLGGYLVIDQCGTPANRAVTALSLAHIALQPLVLTLFMLALLRVRLGDVGRRRVIGLAALGSAVMVAQFLGWPGAPGCLPGRPLCGQELCTVSGDWHLAWTAVYADIFAPWENRLGTNFGFPAYGLVVFLLPVFYGAWRFALCHALIGPVAANLLTSDVNEAPAIWCLASVLILSVSLVPRLRRFFASGVAGRAGTA